MRLASILAIACASLLLGWRWLGVYTEREFATRHLFLKNRPTWQFFFRPAHGEFDGQLGRLDDAERGQELAYRRFVEDGGGWRRSVYIGDF